MLEKRVCSVSISKYKVCFTALISLMLLSSIIVTGKNSEIGGQRLVANASGPYSGMVNEEIIFIGSAGYTPSNEGSVNCEEIYSQTSYLPITESSPDSIAEPVDTITAKPNKDGSDNIAMVKADGDSSVVPEANSLDETVVVEPVEDIPESSNVDDSSITSDETNPTVKKSGGGGSFVVSNVDGSDTGAIIQPDEDTVSNADGTSGISDNQAEEPGEGDSIVVSEVKSSPVINDEFTAIITKINSVQNPIQDTAKPPDDNDGFIYRWDFNGDGEFDTDWSTLSTATHIYSVANTYTVTLKVMDEDGLTAIDSTLAIIEGDGSPELPPKVYGLTVWDTQVGGQLSLSWDLPDTYVNCYQIYRDNEPIDSTSVNYYKDNELINGITYWYEVSAINDSGEGPRSDPAGGTPTDSNIPPIADASDGYFQWIEPILFDASDSYDPDGYIVGYRWDFDGDKQFDTVWLDIPTISYWYDDPGTYTVTLEVMDNESATDNDTTVATVVDDNELPVADAGGPYIGFINESILFDGSNSYDPDGTIVNYTWDFGDGIIGYGVTETHVYTKNGTFEVKLTVKDNRSGINIDTTHAEIRDEDENRAPSKPEVTVKKS